MATLATLRSAVAGKIGLDNTTTGDQGSIDNWINEGYLDVCIRACPKIVSATASLTSGTKDYTLDTNILKILSAYTTSSSTDSQPEIRSPEQIIQMRLAGSTATSPVSYYAVAGGNLLMVYPTPSSADTLTLYYQPRPTALSVSSDQPSDVPAEFHKLIEWYACSEAADYDDTATKGIGQKYWQQYEQGLARMRREVHLKGNHRLPRANIRPRATPVSRDRSRYP